MTSAVSQARPGCSRHEASAATASTTGVNSTVGYVTVLAAARARPAAASSAARLRKPAVTAARTASQAARASRNSANASKVANAPRNWVPARVAKSPDASSAARRP